MQEHWRYLRLLLQWQILPDRRQIFRENILLSVRHFQLCWVSCLTAFCLSLLSGSSRHESGLVHRCCPSVRLSVCRQNAKKRFSQKLSNLEIWSLLATCRKLYTIIGPLKSKMAEILHLENRHDVIFSAEGGPIWIKFRRLVQNDISPAVIWSKSKPDVEFQYVWANYMACPPRATCHIEGAATWRFQCHDPRATCHIAGCCHLMNSLS